MKEVVRELKKDWQVIIFTASHPHYANTILDYIDPDKDLFEKRVYRDSCFTTVDRVHIKDLRIFERDLKDIVIVDNASHSFGFQIPNGIPMLPFFDDKEDREMIHLMYYLKRLVGQDDLKAMVQDTYQLHHVKSEGFCEAIEGVIEYTILEVNEEEIDLDQNPEF